MCYDVNFLTKNKIKYARRFADSEKDIKDLEEQLKKLGERIGPHYHASGFEHPDLPVITNENPREIQLLNWGLIPSWTKDVQSAVEISNRTLNARSETMFEKPAYKESSLERRCLVIVDGFFEHHWKNGKSYPYHIFLKDGDPMALGGIWSIWKDRVSGLYRKTFSIVTTKANSLLNRIHNNPKASIGPRMPLIIPKELEKDWLGTTADPVTKDIIGSLIAPFDAEQMDSYTVPRLRGKLAIGNSPQAVEHFDYDELNSNQGELF